MSILLKLFLVLTALFLAFKFYVPLLQGQDKEKRIQTKILFTGIAGGFLSGILILIFKKFIFPEAIREGFGREVLSMTLFISFIEAGLLEEIFKISFYILALRILNKNFKLELKALDYMLLGTLIGFGFGLLENIYYIWAPEKADFWMVIGRTFTSLPAHMIMCSIFGFCVAQRKPIQGTFAAIIVHGIYDFFALPATIFGNTMVDLWLLFGVCLCLVLGKKLHHE